MSVVWIMLSWHVIISNELLAAHLVHIALRCSSNLHWIFSKRLIRPSLRGSPGTVGGIPRRIRRCTISAVHQCIYWLALPLSGPSMCSPAACGSNSSSSSSILWHQYIWLQRTPDHEGVKGYGVNFNAILPLWVIISFLKPLLVNFRRLLGAIGLKTKKKKKILDPARRGGGRG